jgi:hypothetical protein
LKIHRKKGKAMLERRFEAPWDREEREARKARRRDSEERASEARWDAARDEAARDEAEWNASEE